MSDENVNELEAKLKALNLDIATTRLDHKIKKLKRNHINLNRRLKSLADELAKKNHLSSRELEELKRILEST